MAKGVVAGNKDDRTEYTLKADDKIILTFGENFVFPRAPIFAAHFDPNSF